MSQKMYALVGNWSFRNVPKGLSVYSYEPETGKMSLLDTYYNNVGIGNQAFDSENCIEYMVHECADLRGQFGGGGYVLAARLDMETGVPQLLSEKKSLGALPSFVCVDKSKKYIVVSHHVTGNYITKIVKTDDGKLDTVTEFDDTALVLFRLNEDGSIGEACDTYIIDVEKKANGFQVWPRLHSIYADPTGELFIACDKGCDKVITMKIDREKGKIIPCDISRAEINDHPRYGVFHKELPFFYGNNEDSTMLYAYKYDVATGSIERAFEVDTLTEKTDVNAMPADVCISPSGKYLYASIRGANIIAVMDIDENGKPTLIQNIDCCGDNPRGLCISLDGKYLFVINAATSSIVKFAVGDDGRLTAIGEETKCVNPANMIIVGG